MSDASDVGAPSHNDTVTAIAGVQVGHWSDPVARTGCTVLLLPPEGAVTSGLALGAAPGSREQALLAPEKSVERAHALLLTGGSAFGLAAADGVMRELEARGVGHPTPAGPVPIVPAAVLFDLMVGDARVRPGATQGALATRAASGDPVTLGAVGAGTGSTVGKLADGFAAAVPSGLGSAVVRVAGALVGVLAVSNAAGDLVDPDTGALVAGSGRARDPEAVASLLGFSAGLSTTLVAVVTDAPLAKAEAHALALSAHIGIARVTRPSHTVHDGDTSFVASTARGPRVAIAALGVAVQEVVARALLRGAREGRSAPTLLGGGRSEQPA